MPDGNDITSLEARVERLEGALRAEGLAPPGDVEVRAIPPNIADGDIITAAHINAIKANIYAWQGNVDASGFELNNLGAASIRGTGNRNLVIETTDPNSAWISYKRAGTAAREFWAGQGLTGQADWCIYDATAAQMRFVIAANGLVGIGTASPAATLDVQGTVSIGSDVYMNSPFVFNSQLNVAWYKKDSGGGTTGFFWRRSPAGDGVGGLDLMMLTDFGRLKVYYLPSTNPGAGSKELWYDPADGNRVKFAP